jgi:hypothetical protein
MMAKKPKKTKKPKADLASYRRQPIEPALLDPIKEAIVGRNDDQRRIALTGLSITRLLLEKNADYGSAVFKQPLLCPDIPQEATIRVRISDKISRIISLLTAILKSSGDVTVHQVKDEPLEKTFEDLAGYSILWLARPK